MSISSDRAVIDSSSGSNNSANNSGTGRHNMQGGENEPRVSYTALSQASQASADFGVGYGMPVDAQYRGGNTRMLNQQQQAPADNLPPLSGRRAVLSDDQTEQDAAQTVHMLRESVASLLSSAASSTSSASSAHPGSNIGSTNNRRRYGRQYQLQESNRYAQSRHRADSYGRHGQHYGASRSPSGLSKVSEPCYPPSAPRRRFTADLDHFSDVALSTTPPHQAASSRQINTATQFPSYEEYKRQQQQQQQQQIQNQLPPSSQPTAQYAEHPTQAPATASLSSTAVDTANTLRRRANTTDSNNSNDAIVPRAYDYHDAAHMIKAEHVQHFTSVAATAAAAAAAAAAPVSVPSAATHSPFASIQTISPVIIASNDSPMSASFSAGVAGAAMISRVQAETALEQAILCPMGSCIDAELLRLTRYVVLCVCDSIFDFIVAVSG
ncbi:hypothetical protein GGI12_000582 [Dipsacomyces acuminosporus]|nr:hypothetical protein GGI12_000582 [Dipsacomyces acuminosporus]